MTDDDIKDLARFGEMYDRHNICKEKKPSYVIEREDDTIYAVHTNSTFLGGVTGASFTIFMKVDPYMMGEKTIA